MGKTGPLLEKEMFRETGKFVNPLSESSQAELRSSKPQSKHAKAKAANRKPAQRSKTGNGRYSRRSTTKNKSEERQDK